MSEPLDPVQPRALQSLLRARRRELRWHKRAAALGMALLTLGAMALLLARSGAVPGVP